MNEYYEHPRVWMDYQHRLQLSTLIFQDFHQIGFFPCRYPYMVSLDLLFLCHPLESLIVDWILISFKVASNQTFLESSGNLVNSAKSLGSGMKCDTSKTDSPKVENALFSSFKTDLKSLCKPLYSLFAESSGTFHSFYVCLIWSRIFNLESLALSSECIWLPSWMFSKVFVLIN